MAKMKRRGQQSTRNEAQRRNDCANVQRFIEWQQTETRG